MAARILSWNVAGLRKAIKNRNLQRLTARHRPDIICLQDIRGEPSQFQLLEHRVLADYREVWNEYRVKHTINGVLVLTKFNPKAISYGIGVVRRPGSVLIFAILKMMQWTQDHFDQEGGRMITIEYDDWNLVNVLTVNSGARLEKLSQRQEWDSAFIQYIRDLKHKTKKPTIIAGDMCVAHRDIDISLQMQRLEKVYGCSVEERSAFESLLQLGFVDSFRKLHPDEAKFTHLDHRGASRTYGMRWRWSYLLVDSDLAPKITEADILDPVVSDDVTHSLEFAPITLTIEGIGGERFEPLEKPTEEDYQALLSEEEEQPSASEDQADDVKPKAKRARRKAFLLALREKQMQRALEQEQQLQQQETPSSNPNSV